MWLPSKSSVVCSVRFMPEDFVNRFVALPELHEGLRRKLIEDDIGGVPAHSVYVKDVSKLDMNRTPPPPFITFRNAG